jgi:hypothetical protein
VLTIACFKWANPGGYQLPSQRVTTYGAEWVRKLRDGVARHYNKPHRFVCVTDDATGLDDIECVPIWDTHKDMGGCYRRLMIFAPEMRELLGPRFVTIDLDCVITGDLTPIFERREDFVMNSYHGQPGHGQHYNGSLIMMNAGSRKKVWDRFDPVESPRLIKESPGMVVGTDQAWIRLTLGNKEARFTEADGVYEYKHSAKMRRGSLPDDARIVFFSGPCSPETEMERHAWIKKHWR